MVNVSNFKPVRRSWSASTTTAGLWPAVPHGLALPAVWRKTTCEAHRYDSEVVAVGLMLFPGWAPHHDDMATTCLRAFDVML